MKFAAQSASEVQLTEQLLKVSRQMIDAIPPHAKMYDVLIVFQVKSHRMLKSTLILSDEGYAVEGEMFLRSMQELLITTKYLLLDPDRHTEMYREFWWIEKWKRAKDRVQGSPISLETGLLTNENDAVEKMELFGQWMEDNEKRYQEAVAKRKVWASEIQKSGYKPRYDSWSVKSNYDMAKDAEISHVFLNLYSEMSDLIHPSTLSVYKYIGDAGKVRVEPGIMHVQRTIVGACAIHTYITQLIAGFYDLQTIWDVCDQISLKLPDLNA